MKLRLFTLLLLFAGLVSAQQKPSQKWLDQKFSMFIHFGIYSEYGGVYDGKPVERGYSEQIQSFAGIFSDWYANTSRTFNPEKWDADEVVALAKAAGMRSIVITSKHHDGFCMYHSKYTKFNIVDATPYKRDLMKELAEACARGGIDFAVYYSLIDWNYPYAYPISSHNADPLTPQHYEFNLKQVEEIMTNYGPISEIWFDMGSLTPEQSKGLYDLVNRLQPQCMISGRLGNNHVDFSVMPDNEYPDCKMDTPWQTAASMFDETWSYRSWQKRGNVEDKVNEKLNSLVQVVAHGGNYLLNIGPRGDGSIVEFEAEVLQKMGSWIAANSDAIYAAKANPLPQGDRDGDITTKGDKLYLFANKNVRDIQLENIQGQVLSARILSTGDAVAISAGRIPNTIHIKLSDVQLKSVSPFPVVEVSFKNGFKVLPEKVMPAKTLLTAEKATPSFGHSSLDYYCGFKSLTAYNWDFSSRAKTIRPKISFSELENGKEINISVDGTEKTVRLEANSTRMERAKTNSVKWGKLLVQRGSGVFGTLPYENSAAVNTEQEFPTLDYKELLNYRNPVKARAWHEIVNFPFGEKLFVPINHRGSYVFLQEIESDLAQNIAVEIGSGNGVYILLNGKYVTAHCLPERPDYHSEQVILPLKKGKNQLVIKHFNRFEEHLQFSFTPLTEWKVYEMQLPAFPLTKERTHSVQLRESQPDSPVSPLRMNNIALKIN